MLGSTRRERRMAAAARAISGGAGRALPGQRGRRGSARVARGQWGEGEPSTIALPSPRPAPPRPALAAVRRGSDRESKGIPGPLPSPVGPSSKKRKTDKIMDIIGDKNACPQFSGRDAMLAMLAMLASSQPMRWRPGRAGRRGRGNGPTDPAEPPRPASALARRQFRPLHTERSTVAHVYNERQDLKSARSGRDAPVAEARCHAPRDGRG